MSSLTPLRDEEKAMARRFEDHAHVPERCTIADIATVKDGSDPALIAKLEKYFGTFAKPVRQKEHEKCLLCFHCGEPLSGFSSLLLGKGGFEWGLAHGEGFCRGCHWPARAHHYVKDDDDTEGKDLLAVRNLILQYHPDFVEQAQAA